MSRAGYNEDCEDYWPWIMYRGAVSSAIKGRRGQAFLKEMLAALDALPEKRLIADDLERNGCVCAIGAVGRKRGVAMAGLDPEDYVSVASAFGVANTLAREVVYENDEGAIGAETPEQRFVRMRAWIASQILPEAAP